MKIIFLYTPSGIAIAKSIRTFFLLVRAGGLCIPSGDFNRCVLTALAVAISWNREFWLRLRVGKLMHDAFIYPSVADWGVDLCDRLPAVGAWIVQATRGRATLTLD